MIKPTKTKSCSTHFLNEPNVVMLERLNRLKICRSTVVWFQKKKHLKKIHKQENAGANADSACQKNGASAEKSRVLPAAEDFLNNNAL